MKYCPKCNKQFDTEGSFCPQCGNKLTEESPSLYCPNCGKKLAAGARFCNACGTSINGGLKNVDVQHNPVPVNPEKRNKSKALLAGIALLLIVVIGGVGYLFSKNTGKIAQYIPAPVSKVLGLEKTEENGIESAKQEGINSNAGTTNGPVPNSGEPQINNIPQSTPQPMPPPIPQPASPPPYPSTIPPAQSIQSITPNAIANAYHSSADQEGNYIHSALLAIDGNPSTCWSEGVPGLGIGENIVIHFKGTYKVSGMNIWIGHQKSDTLFYQNARPRSVRVMGSDGSSEVYFLSDTFGVQRVNFKQPINTSLVKIIVDQVMPGNKYEDTCIAEVSFF